MCFFTLNFSFIACNAIYRLPAPPTLAKTLAIKSKLIMWLDNSKIRLVLLATTLWPKWSRIFIRWKVYYLKSYSDILEMCFNQFICFTWIRFSFPFVLRSELECLIQCSYRITKGQLISKGLFGVIVSTKKPTKFF